MREVVVEGARIGVRTSGAGEPVGLLHSSAGSSAQWRALSAALESDYGVIAPDLFGCGGSEPWPGHRPITLADEASLVAAAVEGAEPVHLVGHSFGGAVALHFALHHPGRVRSLTLIEPVLFHLLQGGDSADRAAHREVEELAASVLRGLRTGHRAAAMACFVDYWSGAGAWNRLDQERRLRLKAACPALALNFHAALSEPTPPYAYRRVRVPTLLIEGGRSPEPVRRITARLRELLPGARVVTLPEAGHMLPLTHGPEVLPLIVRHLEDARGPEAKAA